MQYHIYVLRMGKGPMGLSRACRGSGVWAEWPIPRILDKPSTSPRQDPQSQGVGPLGPTPRMGVPDEGPNLGSALGSQTAVNVIWAHITLPKWGLFGAYLGPIWGPNGAQSGPGFGRFPLGSQGITPNCCSKGPPGGAQIGPKMGPILSPIWALKWLISFRFSRDCLNMGFPGRAPNGGPDP